MVMKKIRRKFQKPCAGQPTCPHIHTQLHMNTHNDTHTTTQAQKHIAYTDTQQEQILFLSPLQDRTDQQQRTHMKPIGTHRKTIRFP